jgi:hypothetical protein
MAIFAFSDEEKRNTTNAGKYTNESARLNRLFVSIDLFFLVIDIDEHVDFHDCSSLIMMISTVDMHLR